MGRVVVFGLIGALRDEARVSARESVDPHADILLGGECLKLSIEKKKGGGGYNVPFEASSCQGVRVVT